MKNIWRVFPVSMLRKFRKNFLPLIISFPIGFIIFVFIYHWGPSKVPDVGKFGSEIYNNFGIGGLFEMFKASKVQKNFTILIWKHGPRMLRRFERSYGSTKRDPFQFCSVNNCFLTIDEKLINVSDAVFFHLHRTPGPQTLPTFRLPYQRWVFFTDESPLHTFVITNKYQMRDYNGYFNWSMTYRSDSDVPVPYGRFIPLSPNEKITSIKNYAASKNKFVAILGSNCGGQNYRWDYVEELKKHINVDVYGGCGELKCPGHFTKDCSPLNNYKFYLSFENCNCREYITEKLWWNAYHKESIPVVMGPYKEDYASLCPPNSFIHVDDFASPQKLALYLQYLNSNDTAYNEYFLWKKEYKVLNEHGYFGSLSQHICRLCEALNFNSPNKVYNELEKFWSAKKDCHEAKWKPGNHQKKVKAKVIQKS